MPHNRKRYRQREREKAARLGEYERAVAAVDKINSRLTKNNPTTGKEDVVPFEAIKRVEGL